MKRFILLTVMLAFVASVSVFAQPRIINLDPTKYTDVVTLSIENRFFHSEREINFEGIQELGNGDYMHALQRKDSIVFETNAEKTKAKVVRMNQFLRLPMDRFLSFNMKEDERRIILYYEDNRIYCGYIYDKTLKACQPFSNIKERKFVRGMRRMGFGR